MVFERNTEAPILNTLYDKLINNLSVQKILYDRITQKFYKPVDVVIADGFDKNLFPDNQLNGKRLIYVGNSNTRDWLKDEFKIEYLSYETIAEHIERECIRQKNKANIPYFENLYKYLVDHNDLNLKEKKVLLTSKMKLLSSEEDVFYGFKEKIEFPDSIQTKIHFIHPKIKISDRRQGQGQTGFLEYNTELLVRRFLKLYDEGVPPLDILTSLLKLNISDRLNSEIRQKILLPVRAKNKWLNPFTHPVYIESDELKNLFSPEKLIDYKVLGDIDIKDDILTTKLLQFGAWNIPAIYFSEKPITVSNPDSRYLYLNSISGYSTINYQIKGDWILDIPKSFNQWFTDTIINNWNLYLTVIEDESNPSIKYKSQTSNQYLLSRYQLKHVSSMIKYLKEEHWILLNEISEPLSKSDVVGVDLIEAIQQQSFLFKKYLKVLPIHFSHNSDFVSTIGLHHLDSKAISTFKNILRNIHISYSSKQDIDKEFVLFYNKILSKLFDLFNYPSFNKDEIVQLKQTFFLGINELDKKLEWKSSDKIYYIEDKPSYDILPKEIKEIIQPHFTNRDRNRFGQIAKRLGLDFKVVMVQEVSEAKVIKELSLCEWLTNISESLGLVEVLLETNLDNILDDIRDSKVKVCDSFEIKLFKDAVNINTLQNVPYKIQADKNYLIYIREQRNIKENVFLANVLNDLLVELLGRDLSTVRLSLIDFFSQSDRKSYIDKYGVADDRVEDIRAKLTGFIFTKRQFFWLTILDIRAIPNPTNYLKDGSVDLLSISNLLNVSFQDLVKYNEAINFDAINNILNIEHLDLLLTMLKISIEQYNQKSEIKIDFRHHYLNQIEGIKQKMKPLFENKIYTHLSNQEISEKSKFQNTIDTYLAEPIGIFTSPILKIDLQNIFFLAFKNKYPYLSINESDVSVVVRNTLLGMYKKNKEEFENNISNNKGYEKVVDEFLAVNTNRSLLYFENTIPELVKLFDVFYKNSNVTSTEGQQNSIDLSQYFNKVGLKIKEAITNSIESTPNSTDSNGHSGGSRIDGGKPNPKNNLIGIVAEKSVYDLMLLKNSSTEWISKNAARAGVNPEGSDSHGCDITYVDEFNQIQYVEVKGAIDNQNHFYITYKEYYKALKEKENYQIILVKFALDNEKREPNHLGNIFLLDANSDVFHNNKFSANFNSLEITFQN
ncbi:MAG: hypothetical protein A3F72_19760 [Bacteroidetes bacterium RIFCSPLOWO2_12_FULL_35_15]|nr:MAG: hypothetical protein A3F72_19760 [Bacteroidetes bacterium RIFCSPLOWO2_12_FULL_35_15]